MSNGSSNYKAMESATHSSPSILIVEDDEALLHLIQKNLQRAGFHTESSSNGAEAISRIVNNPPDLLLLDYRLPDMTGKQVIEALTKQGCTIPFIVITGHGDEKVAVEMMKLGARDYLVKDVVFLDLLPSVAKQTFKQLTLERQLAESGKALRESEERLRSYLESSPDGIYFHDLEGVFLYVNKAAETIMGYSREELVGKSIRKLAVLPPEYWAKARMLQESNVLGRPAGPVEFELIRKNKSRAFVEISTYPIVRGDKTEVISIARDIRERKKTEEALQRSEGKFKRLVEDMNDGYIVVQDFKVVFANAMVAQMFGYNPEEVIGKHIQKLLGFEVPEWLEELHRRRMRGEVVPQQYEIELAKKDGTMCTAEFSV